jgi:hypothetical protein
VSSLQRFILDRRVFPLTEIDPATVPPGSRVSAARALEHATTDLELPSVRIRWFRRARPGEPVYVRRAGGVPEGVVNGERPTEIGIRAGLSPLEVVNVVLHEAMHVRQFLDGRDGHSPECQREAETYGSRLARNGVARAIADAAIDDAARQVPARPIGRSRWGWWRRRPESNR